MQRKQLLPKWIRHLGPGLLVTAAFIGPGTVTKATTAGASFGYALMWAVVFSVAATIIFQEMAARLGIVTGQGLGHAIRRTISNPVARAISMALVFAAIVVGNAAYQAGNIAGAAVGMSSVFGTDSRAVFAGAIGAVAFIVLWMGSYEWLQKALVALVVVMSCVFCLTALSIRVDWWALLEGLTPSIPKGGLKEVLAIIGTTVVPYNLFLHASASAKQWAGHDDVTESLQFSRIDTTLSVALGGLVTAAVMVTASGAFFGSAEGFTDLADAARQLEPLVGRYSRWLFGFGLFAAGLTSAITAPMAAAYAASGCFAWPSHLRDWRMRLIFGGVILCGTYFAVTGASPTRIITIAQVANGLLLPLMAVFLIFVMNNAQLLGHHRNRWFANCVGLITVAVVALLGMRNLYLVVTG